MSTRPDPRPPAQGPLYAVRYARRSGDRWERATNLYRNRRAAERRADELWLAGSGPVQVYCATLEDWTPVGRVRPAGSSPLIDVTDLTVATDCDGRTWTGVVRSFNGRDLRLRLADPDEDRATGAVRRLPYAVLARVTLGTVPGPPSRSRRLVDLLLDAGVDVR